MYSSYTCSLLYVCSDRTVRLVGKPTVVDFSPTLGLILCSLPFIRTLAGGFLSYGLRRDV